MIFIAEQELSSPAATLVFSNIPQGYKHLFITGIAGAVTSNRYVRLQFNSITGAVNYAYSRALLDSMTTFNSSNVDYMEWGDNTNNLKAISLSLSNYSATDRNKGFFFSTEYHPGFGFVENTAAITSLTFYASSSDNLLAGTKIALYGIG